MGVHAQSVIGALQENLLGIIVNPMSGRDVRRVAARASTSTHYEKQQQVTRLVLAALHNGVTRIFLGDEPFRISSRAVEHLPQRASVDILKYPLTHTARDTETMADLMWAAGCRTFIVLGGDGTNRIIARRYPDGMTHAHDLVADVLRELGHKEVTDGFFISRLTGDFHQLQGLFDQGVH